MSLKIGNNTLLPPTADFIIVPHSTKLRSKDVCQVSKDSNLSPLHVL